MLITKLLRCVRAGKSCCAGLGTAVLDLDGDSSKSSTASIPILIYLYSEKCSDTKIRYYVILHDVSPVYAVVIMNRPHKMTVI